MGRIRVHKDGNLIAGISEWGQIANNQNAINFGNMPGASNQNAINFGNMPGQPGGNDSQIRENNVHTIKLISGDKNTISISKAIQKVKAKADNVNKMNME